MTERGEIIGLFLEKEVTNSGYLDEVVSDIESQDGLVVIPHPFDEMRHSAFHPTKDDVHFIDCIEGFNSRCVFKKYNDIAVEFGKIYDLAITAGSDAHFLNEIGNAGIITEKEDLRKALRKGDFEIFGNTSSIINHAKTKIIKLKTKYIKKEEK
jgi:predicted metal-dependent phosphoesterase TrpH